jgi:hypothetical protein
MIVKHKIQRKMFPKIISKMLNNFTLKILILARQAKHSIQRLMIHGVLVAQMQIEPLMPLYISAASCFLAIKIPRFM